LLGSGIAAFLNTSLPAPAIESWGWRIPFLLGGAIGAVGVYMRRQIDESPAYRETAANPGATTPLSAAVLQTLRAVGLMVVSAVQFYIFLAYMPTFAQRYVGLGPPRKYFFSSRREQRNMATRGAGHGKFRSRSREAG